MKQVRLLGLGILHIWHFGTGTPDKTQTLAQLLDRITTIFVQGQPLSLEEFPK